MTRENIVRRAAVAQYPDRVAPEASLASGHPLLHTLLAGRYRLEEPLGRSDVAEVYRAIDTSLGRTVAVKVFRPGGGPLLVEQRRRGPEARIRAGLHHAHLVVLHDAGVSDGHAYLVLQYVDGVTLADRLRDGPLPPVVVARIGAVLADALSYIHAHGVTHRNVKPSNVLLAADGGVYLTDLSSARTIDAHPITATGAWLGTAAYLAPEQISGEGTAPASDVYALGLILLECLTGQRVYPASVTEAVSARLARRPWVPDDFGLEWRALLTAVTVRNPADRPSARVVMGQLGRLALAGLVDAAVAATSTSAAAPVEAEDPSAGAPAEPAVSPAESPERTPHPPGTGRTKLRRVVAASAGAAVACGLVALALIAGSPSGQSPLPDRVRAPQQPASSDPPAPHGGATAGPVTGPGGHGATAGSGGGSSGAGAIRESVSIQSQDVLPGRSPYPPLLGGGPYTEYPDPTPSSSSGSGAPNPAGPSAQPSPDQDTPKGKKEQEKKEKEEKQKKDKDRDKDKTHK